MCAISAFDIKAGIFCSAVILASTSLHADTSEPLMLQQVRVLSHHDSREDAASRLSIDELMKYGNIGRVECPIPQGTYNATGWIAFSVDTGITVAHAFVNPISISRIEPRTCTFAMYDAEGRSLDRIPILFARTPWNDPAKYLDRSFDYAIFKLTRSPYVGFTTPRIMRVTENTKGRHVRLLAFHGDLKISTVARITRGQMYNMNKWANIVGPRSHYRVSDRTRLFVADYDSNQGASGGLVIEPKNGAVIGLHIGSSEFASTPGYDPILNFNYGLLFTTDFVEMAKEVAAVRTSFHAQLSRSKLTAVTIQRRATNIQIAR